MKQERAHPIDELEYSHMIDVHGRITDSDAFLNRVFQGVSSFFQTFFLLVNAKPLVIGGSNIFYTND